MRVFSKVNADATSRFMSANLGLRDHHEPPPPPPPPPPPEKPLDDDEEKPLDEDDEDARWVAS